MPIIAYYHRRLWFDDGNFRDEYYCFQHAVEAAAKRENSQPDVIQELRVAQNPNDVRELTECIVCKNAPS